MLIGTFREGRSSETTTAPRQVNVVEFRALSQSASPIGKSIGILIDELSNDLGFAQELSRARMRKSEREASGGSASLKNLRLSKGLSQAQLAEAVGMKQPHIARIERGNSCPTLQTCRRLAAALDVDLNTIDSVMPQVSDRVEANT